MGESKEKGQEAAPAPAGGGGGKMIIMMAVTSLISVAVALAIVYLVIVPKLNSGAKSGEEGGDEEEVAAAAPAEGEGGGHGEGGEGGESSGPPSLKISFDEGLATVVMPSADVPSSILQYKVTLVCGNMAARNLVEANKERLTAKIRELHSYKKREELTNPQTEKDIEKQILQDCNAILQELLGKPSEKTRIVEVYHEKFFIQDM